MKKTKSNLLRLLPVISILLVLFFQKGLSQSQFCNHELAEKIYYEQNPNSLQHKIDSEKNIHSALKANKQTTRANTNYTIPVVFHILHKNENIGTGSNIDNSRILQALSDLNGDFASAGIQFCLAQQDPDGISSYDSGGFNDTGIQRVDASGVNQFLTYGIWSGFNEVEAKALSNWPENDYLNIWVAHKLYLGNGLADGFAYFPPAGDEVDGIALAADATGTANKSKVITHEAGHYLWLYHTFHMASNSSCPPDNDCQTEGDRICQTIAHKTFYSGVFPCDESQYQDCNTSFPFTYQVTENHMNYTSNTCRIEFVPEQELRMRTILETQRNSLTYSIGCQQGCTNVTASFTTPNNNVMIGSVPFTNTSTGSTSQSWRVDGEVLSNTVNYTHTFSAVGIYEVCLDASDATNCTSRYCQTISVLPLCNEEPDTCEKVVNGSFEELFNPGNTNDFDNVCGWRVIFNTPFLCDRPDNNALGLYLFGNSGFYISEWIASEMPLDFEVGDVCKVSFDYLVTNQAPDAIQIALVDNNNPITSTFFAQLPSNATIIAQVDNPPLDYSPQPNHQCYDSSYSFHHYEATFVFTDPANVYIAITGIGNTSTFGTSEIFFDNISINCCDETSCAPIPDFTWEGCNPTTFTATNAGDPGDYYWTYVCDGSTATGQTTTKNISMDDDCEVCLTIACDDEVGETICKMVSTECEEATCISVDVCEVYCLNQGTADPNDDYWYFSIIVKDHTGSGIFWTTTGDVIASGPYNEKITIYPIGGTILGNPTYTFTVFDIEDPECGISVTVNAPEPCSVICELDVSYTVSDCDDNGTPNYISDDTFEVVLTIKNTFGQAWMVKQKYDSGPDNLLETGVGDMTVPLTFNVQDGDFTLWVFLTDYFDCLVDIYISAPQNCKNCLQVETTNIVCYDNGTSNPNDDYWSFDLSVMGGPSYWKASSPVSQDGNYGQVETIVVYNMTDPLNFTINDALDDDCEVKLTVDPPEPCSEECNLEAELESYCIDSDDGTSYYIEVHVSVNTDECFMVKRKNLDGSEIILGTYNSSQSIDYGPFVSSEKFTLWIVLCDDPECVRDYFVMSPDCNDEGDGENEGKGNTGKFSNQISEVIIYPNPLKHRLNIKSASNIQMIRIMNSTGSLVESQAVNAVEFTKDLTQYESGVYFIHIVKENGNIAIKKFLKLD